MNNEGCVGIALQELTHTLSSTDEVQTGKSAQLVDEADGVFCAGVGRNGFQVKGLAMRLMHMDVASYVVGETCTPNIEEGDVLVVCSESGKTKSFINHATKAKETGIRVAPITINPNSDVTDMVDVVIKTGIPLPKSVKQGDVRSIQPMGSLFEQSEGTFMDAAVMMPMEHRGKDSDTIFGRHASME